MRKYYLIDHKLLFLFGYVFYLFTPYLVGVYNIFPGFPGMELYQGFFRTIPNSKLADYATITLLWLPAFYGGHLCFKLIKPYKKELRLFEATATSRAVPYIALALAAVLLIFSFISRDSLFGGYRSYDVGDRGKMSTLLVIFNFFLVYQLISRQRVSYLLIAGTVVTCFFLLSMGGRMYVFQTFVAFLVFKTSFSSRRWRAYQIVGFAALGLFIGSSFGLWRMGTTFSFEKAAYSLFAEPAFTWFSTSTFLASNDIPLFNIPWNFLTSFLNLIPNTVVSLKAYMVTTQQMGYSYQNPLGADSVWSTFIINFGSAGSFIFLFLMGFLLNFLRHLSEDSRFGAVYYILVCSILPFQFFRDGFYILNKQLFFNFVLFPGLILMLLKTTIILQQTILQKEQLNKSLLR